MPETTRQANALKSKVRAQVEHVFAAQKDKMDLFVRTIGIARATTKIGMANIVYNMKRQVPPCRRLRRRYAVETGRSAGNGRFAEAFAVRPASLAVVAAFAWSWASPQFWS